MTKWVLYLFLLTADSTVIIQPIEEYNTKLECLVAKQDILDNLMIAENISYARTSCIKDKKEFNDRVIWVLE